MGRLGPRCGTFTATRSRVWQDLNNEHLSLPTNGALRQRTAGEFLVPLSIVLLKVTAGLVRHSQQLTVQGELSPSATIGEEAVVADPLKALGENVHHIRKPRINSWAARVMVLRWLSSR